jgi:3-methyladenine DNA glycosylase AlkD
MLREAGKQSEPQLVHFIKTHYSKMPRTTLRYAIERMPEAARRRHLNGEFD